MSSHLASRQDVGRLLRESGAETVEFRASVILGSGSISFEMIRGLVDRLPVLIAPRWVNTLTQPIAVEDVLAYLLAALDVTLPEPCAIYEIGGADKVSYGGMMKAYAASQGLREGLRQSARGSRPGCRLTGSPWSPRSTTGSAGTCWKGCATRPW